MKKLGKKLKQIEELEEKMKSGLGLNDDQSGKVAAKPTVLAELERLLAAAGGF